jgi:hypothetical protein
LIFANVGFFIERLQEFIDREKHPVRQVVIDASAMPLKRCSIDAALRNVKMIAAHTCNSEQKQAALRQADVFSGAGDESCPQENDRDTFLTTYIGG